jgi:hypothetical protein
LLGLQFFETVEGGADVVLLSNAESAKVLEAHGWA